MSNKYKLPSVKDVVLDFMVIEYDVNQIFYSLGWNEDEDEYSIQPIIQALREITEFEVSKVDPGALNKMRGSFVEKMMDLQNDLVSALVFKPILKYLNLSEKKVCSKNHQESLEAIEGAIKTPPPEQLYTTIVSFATMAPIIHKLMDSGKNFKSITLHEIFPNIANWRDVQNWDDVKAANKRAEQAVKDSDAKLQRELAELLANVSLSDDNSASDSNSKKTSWKISEQTHVDKDGISRRIYINSKGHKAVRRKEGNKFVYKKL